MALPRKKRGSARDPKWRLVERIVSVLERSLTPDAKVQHDQKLPVLVNPGRRRRKKQFDVVIRYGRPPRETLTVVEVQDRSRPVGSDQLAGWCNKMKQVGAQHLICVSKRGFTDSAKQDAMARGPTVRLMTLKQLEEGVGPLQVGIGSFSMMEFRTGPFHADWNIWIDDIVKEALSDGRAEANIHLELRFDRNLAALYQVGRSTPASFNGLIEERRTALFKSRQLGEGLHKVKLLSEADGIFDYIDGATKHRFTFDVTDTIQVNYRHVPMTCLSYEQEQIDGALAWIMNASFSLNDKDVDVRMTFVPDGDGNLAVKTVVFGMPSDATFEGELSVVNRDGAVEFQHRMRADTE